MTTDPHDTSRSLAPSRHFTSALDPFTRLRTEMDDLFGRYFRPALTHGMNGDMLVALDTAETEDAYEFKLDVPGVKREDIEIDYELGKLTVSGERHHEATEKKKAYRRTERAFGKFTTSFALPPEVNGDKISAELIDGVLTVTVPKSEDVRKKAKRIEVKGI